MADAFFAGLSGISDAVARFSAAASAGVGVNESGGQALLKAIDTMHDGVTDALAKADRLAQEPPLGTTPAAQVYKPFLATIATDPVQGFIPAMRKFQEDLVTFRADVEKSMATYEEVDQGARQGITKAGGPTLFA